MHFIGAKNITQRYAVIIYFKMHFINATRKTQQEDKQNSELAFLRLTILYFCDINTTLDMKEL